MSGFCWILIRLIILVFVICCNVLIICCMLIDNSGRLIICFDLSWLVFNWWLWIRLLIVIFGDNNYKDVCGFIG